MTRLNLASMVSKKWRERVARTLVARLTRREDGMVSVLVALCLTALLGFVALAVDAGTLYVNRTQLQKAVDAAALAGAYDIGVNGSNTADAQGYAVRNGAATPELIANRAATVFASGDAWTVSAQRSVPLVFAPLLGISTTNVSTNATAINSPAKSFDSSYLMPWAVWGGNNLGGSDPLGLNPGDLAVFRVNDYGTNPQVVKPNPCDDKRGPPCNPNWQINDNAFKGYFHDMTGTINQGGNIIDSKGGNACGQEPIGRLTSLPPGTPAIFPVIDSATGQGGDNVFHVIGFVALQIHSTDCGGGQMDGYVMNWTTWNAQPAGTKVPGLPSVTVLKLWQ